jgi:hypothetical protein
MHTLQEAASGVPWTDAALTPEQGLPVWARLLP